MSRYEVRPDTSTLIIEARSSMGPISFETTGLTGWVEASIVDGTLDLTTRTSAALTVPLTELRSGNDMFDAELARRIESRIHPEAEITLGSIEPMVDGERYQLTGEMRFHGVTRGLAGTIKVDRLTEERIVVVGDKAIDIRDFRIAAPTMLMLKIQPDVRVLMLVEAVRSPGEGG